MDFAPALFSELHAWHWFALALLFLVGEIFTGTSNLLWPAAAAALVGLLASIAPPAPMAQVAGFAVLTIALVVTGRKYVRGRWLHHAAAGSLNERAQSLIGEIATAEDAFDAGVGRVRLGDTVWRARCHEAIAAGDKVEVAGVDGATLVVKRAGG